MEACEYNLWAARRVFIASQLPESWPGKRMVPGSTEFARQVKVFQEQHTRLKSDGMLGPLTLKALRAYYDRDVPHAALLLDDVVVDFPGPVVQKRGLTTSARGSHEIQRGIIHVDQTWSASACFSILKKRKLSTHFAIDGDLGQNGFSTLYQFADPGLRYCLHAGKANSKSIGVDMNTPLSMKYQEEDQKRRGRSRPIVEAVVRDKIRVNLGVFPEQLTTLKVLIEQLNQTYGIPLAWPRGIPSPEHPEGKPILESWNQWTAFRGWFGHCTLPFTDHYCPGSVGKQVIDYIFS